MVYQNSQRVQSIAHSTDSIFSQKLSNFSSSESRSDYRSIDTIVPQNGRIEYEINQLNRTVRKVFEHLLRNSVRQHITVFLYRWLIDRITSVPYGRWLSRMVDPLLMAIENHGGQDNV